MTGVELALYALLLAVAAVVVWRRPLAALYIFLVGLALHNAAMAGARNSQQSIADAAAQHARAPSAFNTDAFLDSRTNLRRDLPMALSPSEVEAWNKAREAPKGFLASLKELFTGAKTGSADLNGIAVATEKVGIHATGAAGRMREFVVILRELSRGDFTRLPRLTYGKSIAIVALWGLLFILVLTMISGARELMTPGAWEQHGATFRLKNTTQPASYPAAAERGSR